jgi:tripartite-type tricarboxylate transporter receptor subunit TctC
MNFTRRQIMLSTLGSIAWSKAFALDSKWPNSLVTFIVPFAPGGGTDTLARTIADQLSGRLGASVIVDNRPGAAGNIGANLAARDTTRQKLLFTTASIAVNRSLYKGLQYDLIRDLQPVSMLTSSPLVLVVPGSGPIKSLDHLKKQAGLKREGLNYGSPGIGTTSQLGCAVLTQALGIKAVHIPYNGASHVTTALMGQQIDFSMLAAVAVTPQLRSGALRAIGIAGRNSPPGISGVPLLTDVDAGLDFDNWQTLFAPRTLEATYVDHLYRELQAILQLPAVIKKINADGALPLGLSPSETASKVTSEVTRYKKIIDAFKIEAN